jgi:hypothetical protein
MKNKLEHFKRVLWLIAAVLVFASTALGGDEASVAILAGRWTYEAAKSRVVDPDLRITAAAAGKMRAEGGSSAPYEFDLLGSSYPLSNGRTISWVETRPEKWRVTKAKNGEVLETIAVTLAGNTLRYETRGRLPDGSPYERIVTYRRKGRGEGLIGLWRSLKVDTGATWDGFEISTSNGGVVTWRIPTDLQMFTGPFDSSDLAIVGPNGPSGSTIAVRPAGPRRFTYVMKSGERIAERGTITISSDRRWLTEVAWRVEQPKAKSKLVYRRTP